MASGGGNWVGSSQAACINDLASSSTVIYLPSIHPSNFIDADRPSAEEVEAAARELHQWGEMHGWWPEVAAAFDAFDPVGREEFEAIVERLLMAAAAAKRGVKADTP